MWQGEGMPLPNALVSCLLLQHTVVSGRQAPRGARSSVSFRALPQVAFQPVSVAFSQAASQQIPLVTQKAASQSVFVAPPGQSPMSLISTPSCRFLVRLAGIQPAISCLPACLNFGFRDILHYPPCQANTLPVRSESLSLSGGLGSFSSMPLMYSASVLEIVAAFSICLACILQNYLLPLSILFLLANNSLC